MPKLIGDDQTPNTRPVIYNSIDAASLQVVAAMSPSQFESVPGTGGLIATRVSKYSQSLATQINTQRNQASPQVEVVDLESHIIDITIETTAQGAGVLTVDLLDPYWRLLETTANGTSFIDVDEYGYLWPPIIVNFPEDSTDAYWRLCQVNPSTDTTQANMSLVFEDNAVSELREHDQYTDTACAMSRPDETRAEYIERCIVTASGHPLTDADHPMRFQSLLPGSVFTAADLAGDATSTPASATSPASPARADPNKTGQKNLTSVYTGDNPRGVAIIQKKETVLMASPRVSTSTVNGTNPTGETGRQLGLEFG
jgi:hypothetical protein